MDAALFSDFCRLLVMIVMLVAAYGKSTDLKGFATSLTDGFHVPAGLSRYAAPAIACAEWLTAAALAIGHNLARPGAALAFGLLLTFTGAIARVLVARRQVSCRCFGRTSHALSYVDLLRNALYMAAAGYLLLGHVNAAPAEDVASQLSLALVAMVVFLITASIQDIRNLLR